MQTEERTTSSAFNRLLDRYRDLNALEKAEGVMAWDKVVLMPKGGAAARTEHTSRLSRMSHEILVSEELRRLVEEVAAGAAPGSEEEPVARVMRREIDSESKLPVELTVKRSRVASDAYDTWRIAKANNDFSLLQPFLEQHFEIAGEMAGLLGYTDHIYDPLMDLFEEGQTFASAHQMFEELKKPLQETIELAQAKPVDDRFLDNNWDQEKLRGFLQRTAEIIGFDFRRGRLDVTTNAFCTNFSRDDVRLTARPSESVRGILFSSLHEMGHGLYEQNSAAKWDGTPLAGGISSGVHESQSRTWENIVGRSLPFWKRFFPDLQKVFPEFAGASVEQFYRAINKVQATPIRVGSDELTYNFHILIRFELECEILTGALKVRDLPKAWSAKYESYLGITPDSDSVGCLQDVHWPKGLFGYFPAYSMGNMMSWQIWRKLQQEIPNTDDLMERGDFTLILEWLTREVYSKGRFYSPQTLLKRITGSVMRTEPYLTAMREKYENQ